MCTLHCGSSLCQTYNLKTVVRLSFIGTGISAKNSIKCERCTHHMLNPVFITCFLELILLAFSFFPFLSAFIDCHQDLHTHIKKWTPIKGHRHAERWRKLKAYRQWLVPSNPKIILIFVYENTYTWIILINDFDCSFLVFFFFSVWVGGGENKNKRLAFSGWYISFMIEVQFLHNDVRVRAMNCTHENRLFTTTKNIYMYNIHINLQT